MRALSITLVVLSIALSASADAANSPAQSRLVVIAKVVEDAELATLAEVDLLDAAADAGSLLLGAKVLTRTALSAELDDALRRCEDDRACLNQALSSAKIDYGLLVLANLSLEPPILVVELLETKTARVLSSVADEAAGPRSGVTEIVRRLVISGLLAASLTVGGQLSVETSPPGAQLVVAESPTPHTTPALLVLPPGEHTFTLRREGYVISHGTARVTAGQLERVRFELEAETTLFESPWFWAGTGVAVAASITAAVLIANRNTRYYVCTGRGPGTCAEP